MLLQEHARRPRHVGRWPVPPAGIGKAVNPACGDEVTVWVPPDGSEILWQGQGCALSQAAASLMATQLQSRSRAEMQALRENFTAYLRDSESAEDGLGTLARFAQIRAFPARVACTLVAWEALAKALIAC